MAGLVDETRGVIVGKYRILGEIGKGGMGVVYLAEDTTLGREVALKSVRGALAEDDELLLRFEGEARAVGKLFHPHIVPINALTREGGVLYIEMPYIAGGSLDRLMEQNNLYCPEVVRYCADVLDALAACHERGIVHRDVKPSNILLDADGRAFLADFGLAKIIGHEMSGLRPAWTTTSFFIGTPRYAPLEAWDDGPPTPAWDLYSIGVILFEGVTGQPVYEAHSLLGHVRALERHCVPALTEVCPGASPVLGELVASLLEADPERRLSDARVARDRLLRTPEYERVLSRQSEATTIGSPFPKGYARGFRTRRGMKRWPAAAGVLVAVLAIVGFAVQAHRPVQLDAVHEFVPHQTALLALPEYHEAAITESARFGPDDHPAVYTEITPDPGERANEVWLLVSADDKSGLRALAYSEERLLQLDMRPGMSDALEIQGVWGSTPAGPTLESASGTVSGRARWVGGSEHLYAALEFVSERQGLRWSEDLVLEREVLTDTAFLWTLEGSTALCRLLFGELMPREAAWSSVVPRWLPAVKGNYAVAGPFSGGGEGARTDGTDEAWDRLVTTTAGTPGWPAPIRPRAHLASDRGGLYLALSAGYPISPSSVQIVIRVMKPPAPASPANLRLQYSAVEGGARLSYAGDPVEDLPGNVLFLERTIGNEWRAVAYLPFDLLAGGGQSRPEFIRFNASAQGARIGAEPEAPVIWGAPEPDDIEHGILVGIPDAGASN